MTDAFAHVSIVRVRGSERTTSSDVTAAEVPLELRLDGRPFAVIMRTPGADRALVAGFLLAERLIRTVDDLAAIEQCADPLGDAGAPRGNIISVTLDAAAAARAASLLAHRREVMATGACGVCGRATLESLATDLAPLHSAASMPAAILASLPARLRERQPLFESTGGLHAAGIFDLRGELRGVAEDVGRHNAVDKVIGAFLLRDELPLSSCVLCVSGRTSYEIVQKAWCASIPIVASVSAPSSLAVSMADEAGITLAGFVRDEGLNIYTGASRIG
jgi:FdhD protein